MSILNLMQQVFNKLREAKKKEKIEKGRKTLNFKATEFSIFISLSSEQILKLLIN